MGNRTHKQDNAYVDARFIIIEYREAFAIRLGCLKGKLMMIGNEGREQLSFVLC